MAFSLLAVRTGLEGPSILFPDPGERPNSVEPQAADGEVRTYGASELLVVSTGVARPQQLARIGGVRATLTVTDSRVAVACSKYDKGSWWFGFGLIGLPLAILATIISKSMAAQRRRGKMLVGHVRHEWLGEVDATDRTGAFSKNVVGLRLANPAGDGTLVLMVTLDGGCTASVVAADIAGRAARFKADLGAENADRREALRRYAGEPTFETLKGGTRRYRLPLPFSVVPGSEPAQLA